MPMVLHNSVVIANGASQTAVIDLTDQNLVGIMFPAAWTTADITLLAADLATGTFVPVHDAAGTEVLIKAAASRYVHLVTEPYRALRYIKLRSGTTASPVNQGADRTLVLAMLPGM